MSEQKTFSEQLQAEFDIILELLEELQQHHEVIDYKNKIVSEPHYQYLNPKLQRLAEILADLHPADIADLLGSLPPKERDIIWELVNSENDGDVLLEASDAVRETLVDSMNEDEVRAMVEELDADEIVDLVKSQTLTEAQVVKALANSQAEKLALFKSAHSYDEKQVGSVMNFEYISTRADASCEAVLRTIRIFHNDLPKNTDKIFVVERDNTLKGVLFIRKLLVAPEDELVSNIMATEIVSFRPEDELNEAATAFERYDLVTAPIVDEHNKLIGRITVDEILDFIREQGEEDMLNMAGIQEDEDLFAPVWTSFKNRWLWLVINLGTAFVASRVISHFEHTISAIVALAALMPIVAGIGGNSGNQTITMIVRAIAMGQTPNLQYWQLLRKEMAVALVNGVIWGSLMGGVSWLLYHDTGIALVMVAAMTLNLLLAAFCGVSIPFAMEKWGKDPALGSSVLITAVTDSGGFLIFLGLASLFLL